MTLSSIIPPAPPMPVIRVDLYLTDVKSPWLPAIIKAIYIDECKRAIAKWEWDELLKGKW
jgi:hypothetical protein